MSFNDIYRVSGSAMTAQTVRLNTIASNLANAESPAASEAATYKARRPVFAAIYQNSQLMDRPRWPVRACRCWMWWKPAVLCAAMSRAIRWRRPGPCLLSRHQHGGRDGDMMSASRNFETNVEVLNSVKSMQQSLLRLGEG